MENTVNTEYTYEPTNVNHLYAEMKYLFSQRVAVAIFKLLSRWPLLAWIIWMILLIAMIFLHSSPWPILTAIFVIPHLVTIFMITTLRKKQGLQQNEQYHSAVHICLLLEKIAAHLKTQDKDIERIQTLLLEQNQLIAKLLARRTRQRSTTPLPVQTELDAQISEKDDARHH